MSCLWCKNRMRNTGTSDFGHGEKVQVEFVSANPTGLLHMGNARGGALGSALANVLNSAGYECEKEYYTMTRATRL